MSDHNVYPSSYSGTLSKLDRASQPDILQLQANANLTIAQANEARSRQLLTQEQVFQAASKQLEALVADLRNRETQLLTREQEFAQQKQAAEAKLAQAQQHQHDALQDRQIADKARVEAADNLAKATQLRIEADKDFASANAARQEVENKVKMADAAFIWPKGLESDAWQAWRMDLKAQAAADWRAALVLYRLQVLSALLRSPDNEKFILEELAALGHAACSLNAQKAAELASALTTGSQGAFELTLLRINDNVDKVWMRPPPNTTKVTRVLGWCVKDKQGTVQFAAQVE